MADELTTNAEIAALPTQEIIAFLNRLGCLWRTDEYPRRRRYVRQLQEVRGISEPAARSEADWISLILRGHTRIWDQLDVELGSRFMLDDWIRREETEVRAFPRGLSVHLLAGNVPSAAAVSLVRALVTKNTVVLKAAARDLLTPAALALSMLDCDPLHPVARSVSAVYWDRSDEAGRALVERADAVCVWGTLDAVEWVRRNAGPEAEIVPFGPRRSVAVVGAGICTGTELEHVALALAHDVFLHDQHACFSAQEVFVEAPAEPLLQELGRAFGRYSELLPRSRDTIDDAAVVSLMRRTAEFLGAEVDTAADGGWTIVRGLAPGSQHPHGRCLYVHEVTSLDEVSAHLDAYVQTVGVAPWDLCLAHRDDWASRGVSRITELGLMNLFRPGATHDGYYPLSRLVRLSSTELPSAVHGKGVVAPINQTERLEHGTLVELVMS
jgi:long-chain-fatty-acyl-CoA reductase